MALNKIGKDYKIELSERPAMVYQLTQQNRHKTYYKNSKKNTKYEDNIIQCNALQIYNK